MSPLMMGLVLFLKVVPWVLVAVGGVAALSWSPLGRGLLRHLREREAESRLTRELVEELVGLKADLSEALERLDATERRLSQLASGAELPPGMRAFGELPNPDKIITPH